MVFFSGLALWILAVLVTGLTRNPNLIPTVVLVGSFLIPATAVIYYLDHLPSPTVSAQRIFIAFLYGGVLGVLAASLLEAWLLQDGPLVYVGVGLIEEFAKVLALLLISVGIQRYTARDGIVLLFEFGGIGVISAVGLWMLRRTWKRAIQPAPPF